MILLITCSLAAATVAAGCVSGRAAAGIDLSPTSQPTAPPAFDVQQLTGQLVAGVQARMAATGIAGNATGYHSEFGVGAVIVVSIAQLTVQVVLVLMIVLSHRREMLRIQKRT